MADEFNYGPRMKIAEQHYQQTHEKNSESGTDKNTSESQYTTSNVSSHSLGSHWKQVATIQDTSDTTLVNYSSGATSDDNNTIHEEELEDLREQDEQIVNLLSAVKECRRTFRRANRHSTQQFVDACKDGDELRGRIVEKLDEMDNEYDELESDVNGDVEDFLDLAHEFCKVVECKEKVQRYMRAEEGGERRCAHFDNIATLIEANIKKTRNIMSLLDRTRPTDLPPLTVFEHDDSRVHDVIASLDTWIKSLPLSSAELESIERVLAEATSTASHEYDGRYKCELVFRHLLAIMSNWGMNPDHTSMETRNIPWQTLGATMAKKYSSNPFESSSYALSSLDDSNLTDLSQSIVESKMQMAVEGPKRCIEISNWSSASNFDWPSTDGHSSVKSVGEEMSLSSYELQTSASRSSSASSSATSVSRTSMPNLSSLNDREEAQEDQEEEILKTALSPGDLVLPQPARSQSRLVEEEEGEFANSMASSFNFTPASSLSLSEMAYSSAHNLLTALQDSANKCGVAVSVGVVESAEQLVE